MKYLVQSIARLDEQENEDSFCVHQEGLFVLSDGAGGVGLFADEWARYLTQTPPSTVSKESFFGDLLQRKISFYEEKEAFLQKELAYADFADKFFIEGSAATIAIAELSNPRQAKLIAYGDSGIFFFDLQSKKAISNLSLKHFVEMPFLINCKDEYLNEGELFWEELELSSDFCVVLASDALAQYLRILYALEHGEKELLDGIKNSKTGASMRLSLIEKNCKESINSVLQEMETILSDEKNFREYCTDLYQNGFIEYDDYTLLLIKSE